MRGARKTHLSGTANPDSIFHAILYDYGEVLTELKPQFLRDKEFTTYY